MEKLKKEFNVNPEDLVCGIGPCIKKCSFEVEEDVKDMFCKKFKGILDEKEIAKKGNANNKYYIDTTIINKVILNREGIKLDNIIDSNICTKCNSNKLHSYREEGEFSGRNSAIIALR